jgi:hypothetical protein
MAVMLSVLRAGRPLPIGKFLVLIYVKRLSRPQRHSEAGRIRSIEKSNNLIGNRIHDLPAYNILPQPTTLPPAPILKLVKTFQLYLVFRAHAIGCRACIPVRVHLITLSEDERGSGWVRYDKQKLCGLADEMWRKGFEKTDLCFHGRRQLE